MPIPYKNNYKFNGFFRKHLILMGNSINGNYILIDNKCILILISMYWNTTTIFVARDHLPHVGNKLPKRLMFRVLSQL